MKKIWVRIGRTYSLTDEQYEKLCNAMSEENKNEATEILKEVNDYEEDDCYIVGGMDCEGAGVDNLNDYDFNINPL